MGVVAKIIAALAAILPAIVEWWAKRRAAQEQAATADRVAAIRSDPAAAWLRKFNEQANPGSGNAPDAPGSNQPDGHK